MEKKSTYTVIAPPHPCRRPWVAWAAAGVSVVAVVVACVTAAVLNEQAARLNHLEENMVEMEGHLEEILWTVFSSHDYLEYGDDYQDDESNDQQMDPYEELTVRRVVRKRRQTNSVADDQLNDPAIVPIYEQAYGVNLKARPTSEGLRLYDSLLSKGEDDIESSEVVSEATDSPIKPYHRISNLWVPKKRRQRLPTRSGTPNLSSRTAVSQDDNEVEDDAEIDNLLPGRSETPRHARLTERRSRTKSLHGSGRGLKRRQKHRVNTNSNLQSVVYRSSHVKATSRHDGFSGPNSVVPQVSRVPQVTKVPQVSKVPQVVPELPRVVEQEVRTPSAFTRRPTASFFGKKRRKPRNKQHRRRRRARPTITLAHFGAATQVDADDANSTGQGLQRAGEHQEWTPAAWMDKLGLNSKYGLERGTVTVKESGLYYLYAQVLYESGRSGSGFQILVDNIPILECTLAPPQSTHSPAPCLTGGLSYLPRNAAVRVRDLDRHLSTVRRQQNTFFGMIKLMDAPHTAEELLLA